MNLRTTPPSKEEKEAIAKAEKLTRYRLKSRDNKTGEKHEIDFFSLDDEAAIAIARKWRAEHPDRDGWQLQKLYTEIGAR